MPEPFPQRRGNQFDSLTEGPDDAQVFFDVGFGLWGQQDKPVALSEKTQLVVGAQAVALREGPGKTGGDKKDPHRLTS